MRASQRPLLRATWPQWNGRTIRRNLPTRNRARKLEDRNDRKNDGSEPRVALSVHGGSPCRIRIRARVMRALGTLDPDATSRSVPRHVVRNLSLIHISEPTRLLSISYAVFCLKKK